MKMTRKDFLRTSAVAGTALFTGMPLFTGAAGASATSVARPRQGRMTLIKGASILSMDPELGDIIGGDVLIDGTKIIKVGHNIEAPFVGIHGGDPARFDLGNLASDVGSRHEARGSI